MSLENAAQLSQPGRRPLAGAAPPRSDIPTPAARPASPRKSTGAPQGSLLSVGQVARAGILVALALGFAQLMHSGRAQADDLSPPPALTVN